MGLPKEHISFFLALVKKWGLRGSVVSLGVPDIYACKDELEMLASKIALPTVRIKNGDIRLSESLYFKQYPAINQKFVHAETFFKMFGFHEFDAIDIVDFEGATIIHDLNTILQNRRQYDVVVDFGTSEHIFNLPALFENIANLLKPQGYVIHIVPISTLNHGFVLFSPTLFYDLYSENGFEVVDAYMIRNYSLTNVVKISHYDHLKDNHSNPLFGYLKPFAGSFISQSFCCCSRKKNFKSFKIPLQGTYRNLYDKTKSEGESSELLSTKTALKDNWKTEFKMLLTRKSPLFIRKGLHLILTLISTYKAMNSK